MLTINDTMNSILKRLTYRKKGYRDIFEVRRTPTELIIGASCFELDGPSLGRALITQIKKLNLHNKPVSISFNTDCDANEVRIHCVWAINGFNKPKPTSLGELPQECFSNA
jgi:hypothetical protein